jgi:hypothetical protein
LKNPFKVWTEEEKEEFGNKEQLGELLILKELETRFHVPSIKGTDTIL